MALWLDHWILHDSYFLPRDTQGHCFLPWFPVETEGGLMQESGQHRGPRRVAAQSWVPNTGLFSRGTTNRTSGHLATWSCSQIDLCLCGKGKLIHNLEEWRQGVSGLPHGADAARIEVFVVCFVDWLRGWFSTSYLVWFDAQRTS